MSLWLVDQGNSRLKLASVPWELVSATPSAFIAGLESIALTAGVFSETLNHAGVTANVDWQAACLRHQKPQAMVVACVAGEPTRALLTEQWRACFGDVPVHWFEASVALGDVRSHYTPPASLGTDRWAALLAARHHYPEQATVVASFGTATTVDALTANGTFLGGMIAPGLSLMRSSLVHGTAALDRPGGSLREFPDNTADALHTGCVLAQFGLVCQMQQRLLAAGERAAAILTTGGAWPDLAPLWRFESMRSQEVSLSSLHYRAYLVLEGLYRFACLQGIAR